MKKFIIVKPGTSVFINEYGVYNTAGILGEPVDENNVYIKIYASYKDRIPSLLNINERCYADFNLSGQKGNYEIIRVL